MPVFSAIATKTIITNSRVRYSVKIGYTMRNFRKLMLDTFKPIVKNSICISSWQGEMNDSSRSNNKNVLIIKLNNILLLDLFVGDRVLIN